MDMYLILRYEREQAVAFDRVIYTLNGIRATNIDYVASLPKAGVANIVPGREINEHSTKSQRTSIVGINCMCWTIVCVNFLAGKYKYTQ